MQKTEREGTQTTDRRTLLFIQSHGSQLFVYHRRRGIWNTNQTKLINQQRVRSWKAHTHSRCLSFKDFNSITMCSCVMLPTCFTVGILISQSLLQEQLLLHQNVEGLHNTSNRNHCNDNVRNLVMAMDFFQIKIW